MFATDIFGHGIDVELVNIVSPPPDVAPSQCGPLLTWTLAPRVLLSFMFAMDIFGHSIDVELINIVPPCDVAPSDMVSHLHCVRHAGQFDTKGLAITYVFSDCY